MGVALDLTIQVFKTAAKNHYIYYHLLSGLDLPLVSQDKIHAFFDKHPHKQFITFSAEESTKELNIRLRKHLFTKYFRISQTGIIRLIFRLYRKIEHSYFILTTKNKKDISYGSNWVSLDDTFVQKIINLKNIQDVKKKFNGGFLVDELFIPYELKHLGFEQTVYNRTPVHDDKREFQGNLRYINWWDGSPYTWQRSNLTDLQFAVQTGHFFSRKFDSNIDKEIIQAVIQNSK